MFGLDPDRSQVLRKLLFILNQLVKSAVLLSISTYVVIKNVTLFCSSWSAPGCYGCSVLYKKGTAVDEPALSNSEEDSMEPSRQEEDDDELLQEESFILERRPADAVLLDLSSSHESTINKVRDLVKIFRQEKKLEPKNFIHTVLQS